MGLSDTMPPQPKPIVTSYNPFNSVPSKSMEGWDRLYRQEIASKEFSFDDLVPSGIDKLEPTPEPTFNIWGDAEVEVPSKAFSGTVPKFQYKGRYIVYPDTDGIIAVDQHRAHIRILFEQNMECMSKHPRPTQKMLFPEIIEFSRSEALVIDTAIDDLRSLGFELNSLGGGSYSLSGVPADFQGLNTDRLLHEIAASLQENPNLADAHEAWEKIALVMAREAAIVYGQVLSEVEMEQLLNDLFATSSPARTPDGKVIYALIEFKNIDKLF